MNSDTWQAPPTPFKTYQRVDELPARIEKGDLGPWLVPDFPTGEALIERGADSSQLAVLGKISEERWLDALHQRQGVEALVPPEPFDFERRLLIILPTYNEKENLEAMVRAIRQYLVCEILVVDDNSPDGTGKIADRLSEEDARLHVLHREGKEGLGKAYLAGFAWALQRDYEFIYEMDCDFSHAPWDLPRLTAKGLDAELVIGSRYVRGGCTVGWTWHRRLLSKGANLYTKLFLGFGTHDWTAGFRCYRAEALGRIDFERVAASGYSFQIEMAWRIKKAGGRVREIPVHFVDREEGKSKMSRGIALEALRIVPTLRFKR
ncbi:MAG: dolichyl-phosphate beta-D-mannosyltransferase [Planctomycetota bacterium]|nr:MAG: dolichyl-phosphate beta-D-mannosyltransferase [Planctomycetota bacterium]